MILERVESSPLPVVASGVLAVPTTRARVTVSAAVRLNNGVTGSWIGAILARVLFFFLSDGGCCLQSLGQAKNIGWQRTSLSAAGAATPPLWTRAAYQCGCRTWVTAQRVCAFPRA